MEKMKLAIVVLVASTVVWGVVVGYAFASTQQPTPPNIPGATTGAGPGDSYLYALKVSPTENSSEWLFVCIVRGNIVWFEEIIVSEYKGELTEPLHEYIKNAIRCANERAGAWILFPDEEFDSVPIESGIYKFKENYYVFSKVNNEGFIDALDFETGYAIRNMKQIYPPTIGSGAAIGVGWIGLGIYAVKQRKKTL